MRKESGKAGRTERTIRMLKDTETKLVPYCDNCVSMFEGTNILKKMFRIYW